MVLNRLCSVNVLNGALVLSGEGVEGSAIERLERLERRSIDHPFAFILCQATSTAFLRPRARPFFPGLTPDPICLNYFNSQFTTVFVRS